MDYTADKELDDKLQSLIEAYSTNASKVKNDQESYLDHVLDYINTNIIVSGEVMSKQFTI